ncbi:bifunctional 2-polyprenyl-6-hydroxyphenol methylase/3-demethylubiquinol 3-O-methyltransferase UbiG [Desulfuromonas acetoxidans]|uniref:Methyltransferase type 11 n=1 Tax=Desulfuromonas acetoxidans (strain DSM 684 / 11070) TaxID=281689 RepID=Q1K2R8_DESA6|nr:methyltransferase domain-containing protein [Desulfuromonas acetoxidans]EAT16813.1 Methyltransferase type 11 [Desulfuromonas acetoxidans DSM 684]MBF0644639.1 methyltransferase domain-containing protein [Desulfuromonas acetoxidans]NVD23754.1 methyltransferase domain-containing protein [Desulfuromonas acetoxidans]NVE15849.1 methyltransferase domain-containing protein [Desulfuromonas acetoxidans]
MTSANWNQRWKERQERPLQADNWLLKMLPLLPETGTVLDIACGRGRNAVYLQQHGWQVTAVDGSDEALHQLQSVCPQIITRHHDLDQPLELSQRFDLVLQFFFLNRRQLPHFMQQVRPGGAMIVRTFSDAGEFGSKGGNPEHRLQPGELLEIFSPWEILCHEEGLDPSHKGGSLAGIVARRPL